MKKEEQNERESVIALSKFACLTEENEEIFEILLKQLKFISLLEFSEKDSKNSNHLENLQIFINLFISNLINLNKKLSMNSSQKLMDLLLDYYKSKF